MTPEEKLAVMAEVAGKHLNSIPVAKSREPRACIETAVNWFGHWWSRRTKWQNVTAGYCAMVFNHQFAANGVPGGFTEKLLFREAPDPYIGGKIFVSDVALAKVFTDSGNHRDADALVRRMKELGFGGFPAVLFDPETGLLIIAECGVDNHTVPIQLGNFNGLLTVANVDQLLTLLYESTLKYPEMCAQLWWKPENHIPIFEAEGLYQVLTFIHLRGNTQGTWVVVREEETVAGKPDITLRTTTPPPPVTFVVEMKVLKSYGYEPNGKQTRKWSEKDNEDWANDGVDQVIGYRRACSAQEAFLLLYDMRQQHNGIDVAEQRCGTEKVQLRKYDIFNITARAEREAKKTPKETR